MKPPTLSLQGAPPEGGTVQAEAPHYGKYTTETSVACGGFGPVNSDHIQDSSGQCDARARYRDANRRTRMLIADALGIAPDAVTTWDRFAYDIGWLDEGACCVNHRFEFTRELEEMA